MQAAGAAVLLIEAAAVLVVTFGSLEALFKLLVVMAKPSASHGMRKAIWRRFGVWLLLGLEFALAADIITSVISPTWSRRAAFRGTLSDRSLRTATIPPNR